MFVYCLTNYRGLFFQNKPDTHWFGSRPLYIFTNPTSPREGRFCPRWFRSECKEAVLEKKKKTSTNIDTEIQKRHKRVKRAAAPRPWKPLKLLGACVFGMNLHNLHTCTYTSCPEMGSFFFFFSSVLDSFEFAEWPKVDGSPDVTL